MPWGEHLCPGGWKAQGAWFGQPQAQAGGVGGRVGRDVTFRQVLGVRGSGRVGADVSDPCTGVSRGLCTSVGTERHWSQDSAPTVCGVQGGDAPQTLKALCVCPTVLVPWGCEAVQTASLQTHTLRGPRVYALPIFTQKRLKLLETQRGRCSGLCVCRLPTGVSMNKDVLVQIHNLTPARATALDSARTPSYTVQARSATVRNVLFVCGSQCGSRQDSHGASFEQFSIGCVFSFFFLPPRLTQ